ncbi:clumping factor B-like [Bactrocera neohumeralis]|uniref:clumping factor B-like n=1 Tax=Bactrocera tryoni TaxID=59916 RepID=UPI001A95D838|nr:clumping factor B-like [Bactrocera tryoni]XP_050317972.1 clumping factor B-like [Bactrocera neohumeralis]
MKSYLVLICSALLVGAFCVVFAAPSENANAGEPATEPAPGPLIFPPYSLNPPRIPRPIPGVEETSESISESISVSDSSSDSDSSSSSESSSEENDGGKPEGRTLFLILRLLQLLQNSTSSG